MGELITTSARGKQHNPKSVQILARSLFRELKQNGFDSREIVSISSELIGLVTTDLRDRSAVRPSAS